MRTLAQREINLDPLIVWGKGHPAFLIIALGMVARVAQYLANRPPWLDESSLGSNIVDKPLAALFGPLSGTQLAPPGFLVLEWVMSELLGPTTLALRLVPLLAGLASLIVFHRAVLRVVPPSAVLIALALFAASDDLIYFASELKQYGSDVTVALTITLLGLRLADATEETASRRLLTLAIAGAAAVWFSHPAAFVLAGVGTTLMARMLARREWGRFAGLAVSALVWLASFVGVYLVAMNQLGHRNDMWAFWDFAFPPVPPKSVWDASWFPRRFLYLFLNPLSFETPLGPRISALPALLLFLVGTVSLARRDRTTFGMLAAPGLFTACASSLHLYPFHGRLVLFLVPALLLLIAEGVGVVVTTFPRRAVRVALIAAVLLFPTLRVAYHLAEPRKRDGFNPYGDLRSNTIDPYKFPL